MFYLVFDKIFSVISFLTIIPTRSRKYEIEYIAKNMYLFPIAGLIIGVIVGLISLVISDHVNGFLLGFIIAAVLFGLTGLHHTDAISDLADGLMVKGSKEDKHRAMADPRNGTAGSVTIVFYIIGIIILVSQVSDKLQLFSLIIIAEILSKYSMVLQCYLGKSAWQGLNTIFIAEMKNKKKIIISTILVVVLLIIFGLNISQLIISIIGMLFVTLLLLLISYRSLGGVSGDTIGASNEISRFFIYFMYVILVNR